MKIGVLCSGSGTNLQAILDAVKSGALQAEVKVVIANVSTAKALDRAKAFGARTAFIDHKAFPSREAFDAAWRLWDEGFVRASGLVLEATDRLLRHSRAIAHAHGKQLFFAAHVRELVRLLVRLKRATLRFAEAQQANRLAEGRLHHAKGALDDFDASHPRPGLWSRREWQKRRARRLQALKLRTDALAEARQAIEPEAQAGYHADVARRAAAGRKFGGQFHVGLALGSRWQVRLTAPRTM